MEILIIALIAGFYMAWSIGANDVANAMGTSVGSGALTVKRAVVLAGIFEFAGAVHFRIFARTNFHTYDLGHLGAYYRQYERLMRHWRDVLGLRILDLSYEDLVADLESTSRKLLDFIGLDWDPRCLRFYEADRVVSTATRSS